MKNRKQPTVSEPEQPQPVGPTIRAGAEEIAFTTALAWAPAIIRSHLAARKKPGYIAWSDAEIADRILSPLFRQAEAIRRNRPGAPEAPLEIRDPLFDVNALRRWWASLANETKMPSTSNETRALMLLHENPKRNNREIAALVPCSTRTLRRYNRFREARRLLEDGRNEIPRGEKPPPDRKTGDERPLEAWDE